MGTGVDVTVIVPTYNGRRTIGHCLRSVERAVAGLRAEIIVVDSSTDDTAAVVRAEFPGVRLIRSEERLTAGGARNHGCDAARGRIICFTDQDCEVPHDWIARLTAPLDEAAADAVGGSVGIRNAGSASGCALYFLEFLNHFPGRSGITRKPPFLVGCNAAYRAEVLKAVRFPDATLGEDVLFGHAVEAAGFRTVYDPQVVVLHENRQGWKTFFSYNGKMGEAAAAYHNVLGVTWAEPFLRQPVFAFVAPAVILPRIAVDLLGAPRGYLLRFLLLSPMCFMGNLWWAAGFRRHALTLRKAGGVSRAAESPLRRDGALPEFEGQGFEGPGTDRRAELAPLGEAYRKNGSGAGKKTPLTHASGAAQIFLSEPATPS
ncbi:hypothetical protein BH23GEM9_BH23GEM9_23320 [soil metagenome]